MSEKRHESDDGGSGSDAMLLAIETNRLVIRALSAEHDLPAFMAIAGREEVAHMLASIPHPLTLGVAREWLAAREYQGRPGFLAGIHLRDGELIGCVGLVDQPLTVHYFFDPAHWGRGYATEALVPFVDWCAAQFGFDELRVGVVDGNIGSRRVLEKAGFKLTHAARHQSDVREEPDRLLMYWKGFGAPEPLGTRTERLHLHPIHTGHATRLSELGNDPAVARMLTFMALPFTPDHAREWIAANQDDPDTFQLAISTLEGHLVGTGTIEIAGSTGRLSGWIGKPYWNDGFGYEALQGLAAIAFNRFADVAKLECDVTSDNVAAIRILKRLGFDLAAGYDATSSARGEQVTLHRYRRDR